MPKTALSARILYLIYISLTLLEILALCLAGMPFYDAVVNTFGHRLHRRLLCAESEHRLLCLPPVRSSSQSSCSYVP